MIYLILQMTLLFYWLTMIYLILHDNILMSLGNTKLTIVGLKDIINSTTTVYIIQGKATY